MKTETYSFLNGAYMPCKVLETFLATSLLSRADGFSPTKNQIIRCGELISG